MRSGPTVCAAWRPGGPAPAPSAGRRRGAAALPGGAACWAGLERGEMNWWAQGKGRPQKSGAGPQAGRETATTTMGINTKGGGCSREDFRAGPQAGMFPRGRRLALI